MIFSRLLHRNCLNVCRTKSISYWLTRKSDISFLFLQESSLSDMDQRAGSTKLRRAFNTSTGQQLGKTLIAASRQTTNQSESLDNTTNQSESLDKTTNQSKSESANQFSPSDNADAGNSKNELQENIYTIPNYLTLGRFLISPYLGYMVIQEQFNIACGLFLLTSLTDVLDGHIARNWKGQSSVLGSVIDPFADKFLVTILAVTLTAVHLIPVWLTALVLSRDLYLIINGFRVRYITLPPPKTFKRYFDFSHPTASVHPSLISKVNTAVQLLLLTTTCAAPVFNYVNHIGLQFLWGLTAVTTSWSFLDYLTTAPYTPLSKQ